MYVGMCIHILIEDLDMIKNIWLDLMCRFYVTFSVSFSGKEVNPYTAGETIDSGQKIFETIIGRYETWSPKITMHNFKML
jgi:hypothetical protein